MHYTSTRGGMAPQTFSQILLGGLAPDGGLTVPDQYPTVTPEEFAAWRNLDYPTLAFEIIRKFADDVPEADLKAMLDAAYTAETFGSAEIVPLTKLEDNLYILGLSNGPTLAFKDMAMQFLGHAFEYMLEKAGQSLNILGATSGDTGSAAEYAMRGKAGIQVFMLSPKGRMSAFQRAQMYSLQDKNIYNLVIDGTFDQCQDIVKAVSNDLAFKAEHKIGAVNSINWGRVVAQTVYYFKSYFAVTTAHGQPVDFAVPSGNFGNVCAGHIARMMGLPIRQLIVATNENDVLDEFFKTGCYRVRPVEETYVTSSPSMDISKASNFERFVYDLVGRDAPKLKALWTQLDTEHAFNLNHTPDFDHAADYGFLSGSSTHADRIATIRRVYEQYKVLIDTHTADGLKVALMHRNVNVPLICLETALPAKFEETMVEALGFKPPRPAELADLESRPQRIFELPADVEQVKAFIANHPG